MPKPKENRKTTKNYGFRSIAHSIEVVKFIKNLTFEKFKKLLTNKNLKKAFIRGFYESDGCCEKYKNKIRVHFYNTNKELLLFVRDILRDFSFNPTIIGRKRKTNLGAITEYRLTLNRREEAKKFFKLFNPCIKVIKL